MQDVLQELLHGFGYLSIYFVVAASKQRKDLGLNVFQV